MSVEPQIMPVETARRLLLSGLGLLDDPARSTTAARVYQQIERMGFVQVDTINSVERAHHHVLYTRLDGYRPELLAKLIERDRRLFEHWTHDASIIPVRWFPHWKHRFARYRSADSRWGRWLRSHLETQPRKLVASVRKRIEREGPLMSKDFEHARERKSSGWWDWKPQKTALEYLWRTGELSIAGRRNFHKVYELTSRWLPEHHPLPVSAAAEHLDWACREALLRLGVTTPKELAHFLDAIPIEAAKRWCKRALRAGEIVEVRLGSVDGAEPRAAFALPDWKGRAARISAAPARTRLLSPFDPVVRDRRRVQRLFGFDYTFEAFVPEAKRRYGYYVLPVLEGERLVGRVDPKLDRERAELSIRRIWWEPDVKPTAARMRALRDGAERFAQQLGADRLSMNAPRRG